jgi:hypothetical protein
MEVVVFWNHQERYPANINIRKNMPEGSSGVNSSISRTKWIALMGKGTNLLKRTTAFGKADYKCSSYRKK